MIPFCLGLASGCLKSVLFKGKDMKSLWFSICHLGRIQGKRMDEWIETEGGRDQRREGCRKRGIDGGKEVGMGRGMERGRQNGKEEGIKG